MPATSPKKPQAHCARNRRLGLLAEVRFSGGMKAKGLVRSLLFSTFLGVMTKTATVPSPHIYAQAVGSAREQGRRTRSHDGDSGAPVEERVAVLEARWEETVPTLATSKDISDLRGEMRNLENRLLRWGVGAVLALLAVLVATFTANTARIDSLAARQDARMDVLDAKLDARFDALMTELRAGRER